MQTEHNTKNKQNRKIPVLFTYFSLGAFALIAQTMMLREFFVVVYGNEFIFAVLLTNWLIGIFTGALTGGKVSERSKNILLVFTGSIMVMCILLPAAITATRLLYSISSTPAGTFIGFLKVFLFSALFIIPISFFIGFVFPTAAKVQSLHVKEMKGEGSESKVKEVKGISHIYIFEALGSLFSGIVYTFFLVGHFNAYLIAGLSILPLLTACCMMLRGSKHNKTFVIGVILVVVNLVCLLPWMNGRFDTLTVKKRWQSISTLPLTYSIDSRYQNIVVAGLFNQYNLYLNTMLASVFPNDNDNMVLAAHLVCQHPGPERILVIGDAVSGLAKFLLRYKVKEVTSVEIDAKTVETILKFLGEEDKQILKDKRFNIIIRDGRKYVKDLIDSGNERGKKARRFDLVYLNVSEPSTLLLNRYYTREFFCDLARVLTPGGVIALNVTSSETYEKGIITDYTASVYTTVKSVFPNVVVMPGVQNFIFASRHGSSISDNPDVLAQRYANTGMEPQKLGMIFQSLYPEEKTGSIEKALEMRRNSSLNTDETPIASLYFNKIIGWYGESNISDILGFFEKVKLRDVIFIILVFFLLRLFYLSMPQQKNRLKAAGFLRFHTLLAVFSAGMAGLSLELVVLYTFQTNFGDIYHIVGFIIAVFMFGLPLGAAAANRLMSKNRLNNDKRIIRGIIFMQVLIGLISLLLPRLTKLFFSVTLLNQLFIFIVTMTIGFAIGFIFPLAIHLYLGEGVRKTGKTAGIVDAFDHLGAAVGAFFIGTLFLPVIGLQKVCVLVALFPFMTAVLLFTDIKCCLRRPGGLF
jgi:spermidine synthase